MGTKSQRGARSSSMLLHRRVTIDDNYYRFQRARRSDLNIFIHKEINLEDRYAEPDLNISRHIPVSKLSMVVTLNNSCFYYVIS